MSNVIKHQGVGFVKRDPPEHGPDIAGMEGKLNNRLPDDYRAFLTEVNGGDLEDDVGIPVECEYLDVDEAPGGMTPVSILYNGTLDHPQSALGHSGDFNFNLRTPPHVFPIGQNGFEHRFCMSLGAEDYGKIYVWVPSPGELWVDEEECQADYGEMFPVASSFGELLRLLRPIDPM